jgi:hypothetical protein
VEAELLGLVDTCTIACTVEQRAKEGGHVAAGPYHCNLNPREMVRGQYNKTIQLRDICQLVQAGL